MESNRLWAASPAASLYPCPWGQEPHFSSNRECLNYATGVPVSSLFLNCCLDFLDWPRTCLVTLIHMILDCWRDLLLSSSYSLIWLKCYGMAQALPGLCWCQPQLPAPLFQRATLAAPWRKWCSFSSFQRCFKSLKITKEKKKAAWEGKLCFLCQHQLKNQNGNCCLSCWHISLLNLRLHSSKNTRDIAVS